jgi:error-prone DNA polymerase
MLHDVLAAVRQGCSVADLGYRALPCGERHLRTRQCLAQLFPPELLEETMAIAQRCRFRLEQLHYYYPREVVPEGMTAMAHLRELTEAGIRERWPDEVSASQVAASQDDGRQVDGGIDTKLRRSKKGPDPISPKLRQQIEKELELIAELRYESYFLTVYDIVKFARSRGILCQGRGSAANSASRPGAHEHAVRAFYLA